MVGHDEGDESRRTQEGKLREPDYYAAILSQLQDALAEMNDLFAGFRGWAEGELSEQASNESDGRRFFGRSNNDLKDLFGKWGATLLGELKPLRRDTEHLLGEVSQIRHSTVKIEESLEDLRRRVLYLESELSFVRTEALKDVTALSVTGEYGLKELRDDYRRLVDDEFVPLMHAATSATHDDVESLRRDALADFVGFLLGSWPLDQLVHRLQTVVESSPDVEARLSSLVEAAPRVLTAAIELEALFEEPEDAEHFPRLRDREGDLVVKY